MVRIKNIARDFNVFLDVIIKIIVRYFDVILDVIYTSFIMVLVLLSGFFFGPQIEKMFIYHILLNMVF